MDLEQLEERRLETDFFSAPGSGCVAVTTSLDFPGAGANGSLCGENQF